MIRKMLSQGNLGIQQRLFSFSFRKMPEGTFAKDEYRNGVNYMCFSKPTGKAVVVTNLGKLCPVLHYKTQFTSMVLVG